MRHSLDSHRPAHRAITVTETLAGPAGPTNQNQTALGHDTLLTTEIYLNLSPEHVVEEFQQEVVIPVRPVDRWLEATDWLNSWGGILRYGLKWSFWPQA